jgi:hypothetical protein
MRTSLDKEVLQQITRKVAWHEFLLGHVFHKQAQGEYRICRRAIQ